MARVGEDWRARRSLTVHRGRDGHDRTGAGRREDRGGGGVHLVARHGVEQVRQTAIVVEAQLEELGGLQEERDRRVVLEHPRDRADHVPPRLGELAVPSRRRARTPDLEVDGLERALDVGRDRRRRG